MNFNKMKKSVYLIAVICLFLLFQFKLDAQESSHTISSNLKWSERMALSIIKRHPKAWQIDNHPEPKWDYKIGMILTALEKLNANKNSQIYFDYAKD